jgi:hypothetical protein
LFAAFLLIIEMATTGSIAILIGMNFGGNNKIQMILLVEKNSWNQVEQMRDILR